MKVERAKTEASEIERQQASNARAASVERAITNASTEKASQGTFASLLDNRRPAIETEKEDKAKDSVEADDSVDSSNETSDGEKVDAKKVDRDGRESSGGNDEGTYNGSAFQMPALDLSTDAASTPPARSILHIADLERIVSAVRSDSFANLKQVTIDLKNSVLDGLQIRLTLSDTGDLKAELLAFSDQVKKQLDARKNELESTLKDRSIKITNLEVKLVTRDESYPEKETDTSES